MLLNVILNGSTSTKQSNLKVKKQPAAIVETLLYSQAGSTVGLILWTKTAYSPFDPSVFIITHSCLSQVKHNNYHNLDCRKQTPQCSSPFGFDPDHVGQDIVKRDLIFRVHAAYNMVKKTRIVDDTFLRRDDHAGEYS